MGFLKKIFSRKKEAVAVERMLLTVLYATARDGLLYEEAAKLRALILEAQPVEFYFINPGSFLVFFWGSDEGIIRASTLASTLTDHASRNAIASFGAAVRTGECIVQIGANGGFDKEPLGITINEAMGAAILQAGDVSP